MAELTGNRKEVTELVSATLSGEYLTDGAFVATQDHDLENGKFLMWVGTSHSDDNPVLYEVTVTKCKE